MLITIKSPHLQAIEIKVTHQYSKRMESSYSCEHVSLLAPLMIYSTKEYSDLKQLGVSNLQIHIVDED